MNGQAWRYLAAIVGLQLACAAAGWFLIGWTGVGGGYLAGAVVGLVGISLAHD